MSRFSQVQRYSGIHVSRGQLFLEQELYTTVVLDKCNGNAVEGNRASGYNTVFDTRLFVCDKRFNSVELDIPIEIRYPTLVYFQRIESVIADNERSKL